MGNRVREQRTQRGLSQAEVAAALGVSRQTVISIEGGRYSPWVPRAGWRLASRGSSDTVRAMSRPRAWCWYVIAACLPGSDQCLAELGRQGLIGRLEFLPPRFGVAALPPGDMGGEVFDVDLYP